MSPSPPFVSFTIPGEGVPKGRPRFNRRSGNFYTPKTTKVYEDCVALLAVATRARYTKEIDVRVEVVIYTKKKSPADIDNISKSVLDGMQRGGMLEDDVQVWGLDVRRVVSDNPRVDVRVTKLGKRESEND